ncbi:hypothetical protein SAMN06309944_1546 [Micrococcales bacterium KH10]|nr:hypothetical protein SAMN06309944_1546 [Micrococcales bacterium KH10]
MPADEIIAPVTYPLWLFFVAIALVALVIVGWIVLARLTRAPRQSPIQSHTPAAPVSDGNPDRWHRARAQALENIDAIATQFAAGSLTERDVHQELAAAVRVFTVARTGVPAETMTLSELQGHDAAKPAAALISELYGPEFSVEYQMPASRALERAREVVARW